MKKKRIALLRSDDAHHIYLDYHLSDRFSLVCRIIEPAGNQRRKLLSNKRYQDYIYTIYHIWRRQLLGLNRYRHLYFTIPIAESKATACPTITVDSINNSQVKDLLKQTSPDVTVIICTSILTKETLDAAGATVINIHGGYLPAYRGNHCFFFAVLNQDFDRIGSTIHFVDAGIDTGDIIERVVPDIHQTDIPEALYCRAEKMAIHRLIQWLDYLEHGGTLPRSPQSYRGRLYRTRDRGPILDLMMWLRRIAGRLILPKRTAPS